VFPASSGLLPGGMTNSHPQPAKPTTKQIRYLKALAGKRGETFTYPQTRAEASAEIKRLKSRKIQPVAERRFEASRPPRWSEIQGDKAQTWAFEVEGYGSTAQWSERG